MKSKYVDEGCCNLNFEGQKVLAVEIRKDKSLREIAEILGVDIETVEETTREVVEAADLGGLSGPTIDKLKKALEVDTSTRKLMRPKTEGEEFHPFHPFGKQVTLGHWGKILFQCKTPKESLSLVLELNKAFDTWIKNK